MSVVALSPLTPDLPSPMATTVTPCDPIMTLCDGSYSDQDQDQLSPTRPGSSRGTTTGQDSRRSQKPPPLHTGADWKVVLHLPEIQKWLRSTSDRVTQLSHSVSQDREVRHVDAHLLQLKDICEDISDHVEQIHALLETEFSLKLLSYSVNIIVDIRTVQLLWHQLRVSVLVLKERLLQGLQDSNGNYTRQTDILQAFNEQHSETRLDALTEVDDCGALTIRCSQDYFSLDCGITAFELCDYSPSEEVREEEKTAEEQLNGMQNTELEQDITEKIEGLDQESEGRPKIEDTVQVLPIMQCGSESGKRHLTQGSHSSEVSPTHPSLPKRAALYSDTEEGDSGGVDPISRLQTRAELSHSSSSLMEPPERHGFWLELEAVYPQNKVTKDHLQQSPSRSTGGSQPVLPEWRSSSVDSPLCDEPYGRQSHAQSRRDSDSPLPTLASPSAGNTLSSDLEASAEESRPSSSESWELGHRTHKGIHASSKPTLHREHWFGSEEFLALPAQLRKTEMLAMNLESLAKSMPLGSGRCDTSHDALQDVDDWDLTELNQDLNLDLTSDWGEAGGDSGSSLEECEDSSPLPPQQFLLKRQHLPRGFSPSSSSSDMAPSSESLESGRISELQSEEETCTVHREVTAPPTDRAGRAALVQKLLQHIQRQDQDPHVWRKMESLVQKLDGFISWLQEALDSTENWTQPRQDLDSLRVYLTTHLSFKLNVDSHGSLKDSIMEEGQLLLNSLTSHQSALRDILHMVSVQWEQLQRQIRRQHGWMLRALRCIQARIFYSGQSHDSITISAVRTVNQKTRPNEGLKVELISSQFESQRAALEQMAFRLSNLQYDSPTTRRSSAQAAKNISLQELEAEYQELCDWLMDMDAMVTDSHQLMMSEEQRHHLFKSSHTELLMVEPRRSSLLSRVESFKRSGSELPRDLNQKIQDLNHTWDQLKKILSAHSSPAVVRVLGSSLLSAADCGGRCALSPLTYSLLEQLEARIKDLKSWLRDTELLIFNSCLRNDKDASQQLASFKSLCSEIRARRRGVSSVLKLCQKLLQQNQSSPTAELGPEAEQHQEALQLLVINLERRWEAIVMQALQWQNRLKRELGDDKVPGNFLEPGLVDLHQITSSVQPTGTSGIMTDDSWEWDETDMTISESKEEPLEPDLTHDLPTQSNSTSAANQQLKGNSSSVYQVYNLHDVELYKQPQFPNSSPRTKPGKHKLLTKSLSKDSSFSSVESLPDILGGIIKSKPEIWHDKVQNEREGGRSVNSRRSESESGIDTGSSEIQDKDDFEEQVFDGTLNEEDASKLEEICQEGKRKEARFGFEDIKGMKDYLSKKSLEDVPRRKARKCAGEAVEILINGRGILTPADSDSDLEFESTKLFQDLNFEQKHGLENNRFSPVLSHGSSLESLLALGIELFPIQRSTSFESGLNSNHSSKMEPEIVEKEDLKVEDVQNTSEELSRRTLDLLQRLENIQSPLAGKMTRSVSDMALLNIAPNLRIPASPSLGGKLSPLSGISLRLSPPSLILESSATASLTELSSAEDSSLASDDIHKNNQMFLDPASAANANFYSFCNKHGNRIDEMDAANLSMVVNVSSACTDDEDDNSDLLSSSTLTEEELGVRDEMEERFSATSSANEDDFEGHFGLDYMQRELQNWIQKPYSKSEMGLKDELQCGSNLHCNEFTERTFINCPKFFKTKYDKEAVEENRRNATRSYISQFVDDVENGNVEQSCLKNKDADDELLREEASVFTKKGETFRDLYVFAKSEEVAQDIIEFVPQSEASKQDCNLSKCSSQLVGQLKGELPCHNSLMQSPPSTMEDSSSHDALRKANGRKAITIQEKFKFKSLVTEQAKREVRDREFHNKRRHGAHCCSHHPGGFYFDDTGVTEENVHNFVMEIIDLTNNVRRNKETEEAKEMEETAQQGQRSSTQIRDKVLEHSHRPVQLRKGDFYSYLSLSSHDSDCGEVLQQRSDDKSSASSNNTPTQGLTTPSPEPIHREHEDATSPSSLPPQSPDIRDEETLFAACTEEVYLGPPLCYSMALPRRQRTYLKNLEELSYELDRHRGDLEGRDMSLKFDCGNMREVSPGYLSVMERVDGACEEELKEQGSLPGNCQSSQMRAESEE